MSFLRALGTRTSAAVERSSYVNPILPYAWGPVTASGEVVDVATALRSAAVAACRRVLVQSVLSMPAHAFIQTGADGRLIRTPQARPVVDSPSARTSKRVWMAHVMNGLVLDGNVIGLVSEFDGAGNPLRVEILPFTSVSWGADANGVTRPTYRGVVERLYPAGRIVLQQATPWVMPGELLATSPVELARESIGTGLAAERFGASFFGDGAHPTSRIYAPEPTADEATMLKQKVMAGKRSRTPVVIDDRVRVEDVDVNPSNSQFIDLMRYETEQAARFFGVPPSMIYGAVSGQAVTYANIADSDLQFMKHSLQSWVLDVQDFWSQLLPQGEVVRLNPDGLLRMDPKARHELYASRLGAKTITVNEIRDLEDEPLFPDPAYDAPGIPSSAGVTA